MSAEQLGGSMKLAEAIERYFWQRRDPRGPDRQMRETRHAWGKGKCSYNSYVTQTMKHAQ